jgi:hypothetical protein
MNTIALVIWLFWNTPEAVLFPWQYIILTGRLTPYKIENFDDVCMKLTIAGL